MSENDYFLSFGSNAKTWASELEKELKPARTVINGLLTDLERLNKAGVGGKGGATAGVRGALANQAGQDAKKNPVVQAGSKPNSVEANALKEATYAQADALKEFTSDLGAAYRVLESTINELKGLPGVITGTLKSIGSSLNRISENAEGRGRHVDPTSGNRFVSGNPAAFRVGSPELAVQTAVRQAVKSSALSLGGGSTLASRAVAPAPSIANIKSAVIDKANFDRVILAIRAQTRVMSSGHPVSISGPVNTIAESGRVSVSTKGGKSVDTAASGAAQGLDELKAEEAFVTKALAKFGTDFGALDEETRALAEATKEAQAKLRAQIRSAEREGTPGLTRSDQSGAARAQAAQERANRPTITDSELESRQLKAALINTPGASDFDSRLGRARTAGGGNYSTEDLSKIAEIFRELGIAVDQNTKTTKAELGERLKAAHAEYQTRYPEGAEALRTTGFNVQKTTSIADGTMQMLGDLNGAVESRLHAMEVISADRTSGGGKVNPASRVETLPGMIGVPPGMVKGRRGTGALIGDFGDSLFTPQDLETAEETLRANAKREMQRVMEQAKQGGFDPYDPAHGAGIKAGTGEGDAALAQAAKDRLRDMRLATRELDKMGQEYLGLKAAFAENEKFIKKTAETLASRAKAGQYGAGDKDMESSLEGAYRQQDTIQRRLSTLGAGGRGGLFQSPGYQQGLGLREGNVTDPALVQAHQFYKTATSSGEIGQDDITARRSALEGEVKAANDAITSSKKRIASLNKEAEAGKNVDVDEYGRQLDKLEAAQAGLHRFTQELETLNKVFGVAEDGLQKVERAVGGMGTRQAYDASREAMSTRPGLTLSDYQLLRQSTGGAVTNVGTAVGSRTLTRAVPGLGFDSSRGNYYSTEQRLGKTQQDKLNQATNQLSAAQLKYLRGIMEGTQTAEEEAAAMHALEVAANKFANRIEKNFHGIAPSFQTLTGFDPTDPKSQDDEARRQATREEAEHNRTRKTEQSVSQKAEISAAKLAVTQANLERAIADRAAAEEKLAKAEAKLVAQAEKAGLSPREASAVVGKAVGANTDSARAQVELNRLYALRQMAQDPAISSTPERQALEAQNAPKTAHLPSAPRHDEFGYDTSLGYGRPLNTAVSDAEAKLAAAEAAQKAALKPLGAGAGVANFAKASNEVEAADRAVGKLTADLNKAEKAALGAAKALEKENAGKGGGKGGGGGSRTAQAGGDDGDFGKGATSVLRQILAETKKINNTLTRGVKVGGRATTTTANQAEAESIPRRTYPSQQQLSLSKSSTPEDMAKAAQLQRKLEEGYLASDARQQAVVNAAYAEQESKLKAVTDQHTKNAAAVRQEERASSDLALIVSKVSKSTQEEIAELARLTKAANEAATAEEKLAYQSKIADQQTRVAGSLSRNLGALGAGAKDQRAAIRTTLNQVGPKVGGEEFEGILRSARQVDGFEKVGQQWGTQIGNGLGQGTTSAFAKTFGGNSSFFDRILHTTGTFIVRNFAAGFVFGLTNELQTAVAEAIKTQQTFVRLSSTLESTGKSVGNLRTNLQGISSQYGTSLNDMYDTAAKLAGVFDSPEQLTNGVRTVAQLQQISEGALDANESVGALTSIWAAFQGELSKEGGAEHVADVATALQNLTGVNIEDTVEGVARLSGLAKQMGISFDETATFVAQISRETNTSGATAGEQLSRILSQAQGAGGQAAIKQVLGADVFTKNTQNGAINYGNILKELVGNWHNLSKAQQENLTHTLAGTRQAATFNALMDNGAKTLDNLSKAENSQGAAATRMAQLMKTLSGEVAKFRSNFQNLVNELLQTGFLNSLGAALAGINALLGGVDHLLALMNQFGESNQAAGAIIHLTATLTGAAVAAAILLKTFAGLKASLAEGAVARFASGFGDAQGAQGVAGFFGRGGGQGASLNAEASKALAASQLEQVAMNTTLTEVERTKLITSSLTLSAALEAHAVAEAEVGAAMQARVAAESARIAAVDAGTATEVELAGVNEAVAAADVRLIAAIEARTVAEGVAAEASAATSAGGLLSKIIPFLKTGAKAAGPAAIAGAIIYQGEKGQLNRANSGADETGGKLPGQGATAAEYKSAADAYKAAADRSKDDVSKGFFGTGIGPSLTKAMDRTFRGSQPYDAANANQANLRAISISMNQAAVAMNHIDKKNIADAEAATGAVKTPTFTSFDTDYLTKRLQDLTTNGQSAGQQLKELGDTLFGVGQVAHQTKGSFLAGGKPTNNLGDWTKAITPGLLKTLSDNGLDVSNGGPDLSGILGITHTATAMGPNGATVSQVKNPQSQWRAKNTSQAIQQSIQASLASAAGQLGLNDGSAALSGDDLKSLTQRGFGDQVATYKKVHAALNQYFKADKESYSTLLGEASLTRKDSGTLINDILSLTQTSLGNLPTSDLAGRTGALRQQVQQIRGAINRTKGGATSQMLVQLQQAQNALAESQFAEMERTRQAAQGNARSKSAIYAIGEAEARKAIRLAVRTGDADLLATIISEAGQAGLALARAAIAAEQRALDAYNAAVANAHAMQGQVGLNSEEAADLAHQPTTPGVKPKNTQADINRLNQTTKGGAGRTKDSTIFSGSDSPGVAAAASDKQDAATLRSDRQALIAARLGVAAAYAEARGDAVAAARVQVKVAAAAIGAAKADLAAASTEDERLQAQAALAGAQAQMIAAHAGVAQAQADLVSSQYDVSIALADAAGKTVDAARRRALQAQAALKAALRQSGGKNTAAVNQARAAAIGAEAAVRDAKLQDELDTIDFNLQMGKITQSAAIHALQQILKTSDLTKAQRQQLLLQIKGMKDEMADSQWNFGDIKLPTPYQMRRYIEQRKEQFRKEMDAAAGQSAVKPSAGDHGAPHRGGTVNNSNAQTTTINIDGADIGMIRKVLKEVVGGQVNIRTTGPRRGGK